jgi:hypothetical protein
VLRVEPEPGHALATPMQEAHGSRVNSRDLLVDLWFWLCITT